jgi:rhodanese-related sulfurtransferase
MQDLVQFSNDNWILVSGFVASGLAVIFYELRLKTQSIGNVSTAMAVQLINNGSTVVDIRDAEQFAGGHIIDAENIPEADLRATPGALSKHTQGTLLVCDQGARSGACAAQLRKDGIEKVFSIKGGVQAWRQENLPTVSDASDS